MTDYLRLRLLQALRSVAISVPGRMVAFVSAGMVLAVGIQFFVLGPAADSPVGAGVGPSGRLGAEVGYAVLLLVAVSLLTGAHSSRFPCTPADVAWVYASPLPIGHVLGAQLIWQSARRCTLWILGGAVVDVVGSLVLDSPAGLFLSRAVLAAPLLVALVAVSVGAGSTRGSRGPARATMALGAGLGAATLVPLLIMLVTGSTADQALDEAALSPLARSVGAVLFGSYDAIAVAALAAMSLVGAALCRFGGAGLREQLTLDAAFWAEFSMTAVTARVEEPKPSFRRLSRLTGPWSILWLEIAALRRANYQRWSLLVLLVTSLLTGGFAPEFVPLFAFAAPLGAVTGAYLSGLARHLRLGTLLLVPGGMLRRVAAAESLHVVLAGMGLALSLAVGGVAGEYGAGQVARFFLVGLILLVGAFAARVAAAALSFRDGRLPGGLFHLTLTLTTAAAAGVVVAISWLASELHAPAALESISLLVASCLGLAGALRVFRYRVEPVAVSGPPSGRGPKPRRGPPGRAEGDRSPGRGPERASWAEAVSGLVRERERVDDRARPGARR